LSLICSGLRGACEFSEAPYRQPAANQEQAFSPDPYSLDCLEGVSVLKNSFVLASGSLEDR
jgi:hypothetical protein